MNREESQILVRAPKVATSTFSPRYPENGKPMTDERAEGRIIQAEIDAADVPIEEELILTVMQELGLSIDGKRIAGHCSFACNETKNIRKNPWCKRLPDRKVRSTGIAPPFRAHFAEEDAAKIEAAVKKVLAR